MAGMKLRHAAALALVGWYLMVPPLAGTKQHPGLDTNAPISHWSIYKSFDTAKACETALLKGIYANDGVPDMFHGLGVRSDDPQAVTLALAFKDVALGQCVASDDPRLKEK